MSARTALAIAVLAIGSLSAYASPIDHRLYLPQHNPDIMSDTLGATYTAATHVFDISWDDTHYPEAVQITDALGVSNDLDYGHYTLHALVDDTGPLSSTTDLLKIENASGDTLLSANVLERFGYTTPGLPTDPVVFEFVFSGVSGTLAPEFGSKIGIIYTTTPEHTFTGSFAADFTTDTRTDPEFNTGGVADNFALPVPEPAGLGILAAGLGIGLLRRRGTGR